MPDLLIEIKRDMAFIGWKGPRDIGFTHKEGVDGSIIARSHDATWWADYAESEARCARQLAQQERESWERAYGPRRSR